jgi:hypothetical protein
MSEPRVRIPPDPVALVRRDVRRLGERAGSRRWGLTPRLALRVAARLPVPRAIIAAVYRLALARLEARRG